MTHTSMATHDHILYMLVPTHYQPYRVWSNILKHTLSAYPNAYKRFVFVKYIQYLYNVTEFQLILYNIFFILPYKVKDILFCSLSI